MIKKCVGIISIALILFSSACIEEESKIVDSAKIDLLPTANITVDGMDSDWGNISTIYEDSEKSMYAAIDNEILVIRMDFVEPRPFKERYFIGIDTDYDEHMEYRVEFSKGEGRLALEKKDSEKWKEVQSDLEGDALWAVEIALPLADLDCDGCYLTGWIYDISVKNYTAHFPWIRSLKQETGFNPELTKNEWKEDFEALYYIIEYNYPYLWVKERTHGYNWLDLKDEYVQRLDKIETNEEFLSLMREAVATLQNRHTQVVSYEYLEKYKETMLSIDNSWSEMLNETVIGANKYWEELWNYFCPEVFFSYIGGEYLAVDGIGDWEEKYGIEKGAKVLKVNGRDVDAVIESIKTETLVWHDCDRDKLFTRYLDPVAFGENTIFTIKKSDGTTVEERIDCVSEDPYKEYLHSNTPNLEFKKWEDKKVAYVKIRSFGADIDKDRSKLLEFYKTIKDYKTLIINILGNRGGPYRYWMNNIVSPLTHKDINVAFFFAARQGKLPTGEVYGISKIQSRSAISTPPEVTTNNFPEIRRTEISFSKEAAAKTPFNGDIYLLVDRWVYSASESFASFAKESGFATLVGTTTGGDGRGGGTTPFVLPNSKLVVIVRSSMGINPDGTANEETHTSPDIYFEQNEWDKDEEIIEFLLRDLEEKTWTNW
ncbi:MAG: S41 family peptidase [Euryarchaeota archaeon]|nr:S41 family peptidase [Euryarchaeota archaeon]